MLPWRKNFKPFVAVELAIAILLSTTTVVHAAPPPPITSLLKQADGTAFAARAYGDEWYSGVETVTGYTILFDEQTHNWVYAWKGPDGSLNKSSLVVGKDRPVDIPKHLGPSPELIASQRPAFLTQQGRLRRGGNIGIQPMLVLLVDFIDQSPVGTTADDWREKIFGNSNSVTHYYKEVSSHKLNFTQAAESHGTPNDGIVGWLHMPYDHPNTGWMPGIADQQLAKDAILAAASYVDFAAFDDNDDGYISRDELRLVLVAAGYEAGYYAVGGDACTPCIRGTAWGLTDVSPPVVDGKTVASWSDGGGYTQLGEWHCHAKDTPGHAATLGIMVHEIGHDLDWPDLYDTDYSSMGVGYWSVMGYGMWLYTGPYLGDSPCHPDAWSKWYQGWITPVEVSGLAESAIIPQVEISPTVVYRLLDNPSGVDWDFYDHSGSGEYFLVENRQKVGYDAGLPGSGLLVWHIDETRPHSNTANADQTRKLVDLEEADGRDDLDNRANWGDSGDPYPGDSDNRTFNDVSIPNSRLYSGAPSSASVTNISDAGATMTAYLYAPAFLFLPLVIKNY